MTENRKIVISKYAELKNEKHFNGITLRDFMLSVFNLMVNTNAKISNKRMFTY